MSWVIYRFSFHSSEVCSADPNILQIIYSFSKLLLTCPDRQYFGFATMLAYLDYIYQSPENMWLCKGISEAPITTPFSTGLDTTLKHFYNKTIIVHSVIFFLYIHQLVIWKIWLFCCIGNFNLAYCQKEINQNFTWVWSRQNEFLSESIGRLMKCIHQSKQHAKWQTLLRISL